MSLDFPGQNLFGFPSFPSSLHVVHVLQISANYSGPLGIGFVEYSYKKAWKFLGNPWIFLGKFPRNPRNPRTFKSSEKEQKSKDFLDIFQEIQEILDFMKV